MRKGEKKAFISIITMAIFIAILAFAILASLLQKTSPTKNVQLFKEIKYPTPNFDPEKKNEILGVILHHTAEPTIKNALKILSSPEKNVSTHVIIDTDGTRYVMADPSVVTYHAGYSVLNGRDSCNYFTIGIEFQGNTLVSPLTEQQIASGIEYLLPLIEEYKIPLNNIVPIKWFEMHTNKNILKNGAVERLTLRSRNINVLRIFYVKRLMNE